MSRSRILVDAACAFGSAGSLPELGRIYHTAAAQLIDLPMRAVYLFAEDGPKPVWISARGISRGFVDRYERIGRRIDPSFYRLLHEVRPVYNLDGSTLPQRRNSELYRSVSGMHSMLHVIQVPLKNASRTPIGSLNFASSVADLRVSARDLETAELLADLFEAAVARVRSLPASDAAAASDAGPLSVLSRREREVAELIADGLSVGDVADRLTLSVHTVRQHTKNIYSKLGIGSRVALTRLVLGRAGTATASDPRPA